MNFAILEIIFFQLSLVASVCYSGAQAPIIETSNGLIGGSQDLNCFLYLGIPYAMPPVNYLRWKEPISDASLSRQILNAVNYKSACPQISTCIGSLKTECVISNVM